MKKLRFLRREFLQSSAGAAGVSVPSSVIQLYPQQLFADTMAHYRRTPVYWDESSQTIKSGEGRTL